MAKVKFYVSDCVSIHSGREEIIDTVKDLGFAEGEWERSSEEEKNKEFLAWMWNKIDAGWIEEEDMS